MLAFAFILTVDACSSGIFGKYILSFPCWFFYGRYHICNYGFNNSSYSKGCEDLLPYACKKGLENKFKNWKFLKQKKELSDEEKKAATDSFCKDEYIYLTDHKNDCDKTCGRCK